MAASKTSEGGGRAWRKQETMMVRYWYRRAIFSVSTAKSRMPPAQAARVFPD
jgi:hypothetical protein